MIYLMLFCPLYLPIPLIVKVGFSHDLTNVFDRAMDLTKAVKWGCFLPILFAPVPFAYRLEKWFHRTCKPVQVPIFKGSGSTETYPSPVGVPVFGFLLAVLLLYGAAVAWAVGKMTEKDGIGWYACFLQVLWGWVVSAWDFIAKIFHS